MRYSTEHKSETRKRLLQAAADAIRNEGPHQVGVAGVMAQAGLTHGGFYAHFESKDALVVEAIDEMFRQSLARLDRERARGSAADGLRGYIAFYLSPRHRDARSGGCPAAALLSDVPRVPQAAREAFARGSRELQGQLTDLLQGIGHDREEAGAAAGSLLAELVGALMLARAEDSPRRSDEILKGSRRALLRRFNLEDAQ